MWVYIPYTRLPSAYQEVEYIQSSGTQYFVVWTSFKTSYKSVIDFQMTQIWWDYITLWVTDNRDWRYGIDFWQGLKVINWWSGWTSTISEDTNRHTVTINKSTATVDGTDYTTGYVDRTVSGGIWVFCYNEYTKWAPYNYKSSAKLYKLDIYNENWVHIYDLVPCYRKSDNVIGMYDLVNNQFYTNSWTGTFSKGNDVTISELKNAYIGEYVAPYLCFTANEANSTVKLQKTWSPTSVTLETSTDGSNWSIHTIWSTITLSNIWDKVYFRNTSETDTGFNIDVDNRYQFVMSGSIAWSWDTTTLLNKNWTTTASTLCFYRLFYQCSSLTTAPKLPATTLANSCYYSMFEWCANLVTLTALPATTLVSFCYYRMFYWCSKIKLSTTKTWEYQTPYRIPTTWTWTTATNSVYYMFAATWWTLISNPSINTTYYTSNTIV